MSPCLRRRDAQQWRPSDSFVIWGPDVAEGSAVGGAGNPAGSAGPESEPSRTLARHSPSVSIWGGGLELLQVLPQCGPRILSTRDAALLKSGTTCSTKRTDIPRPEALPDGEAITARAAAMVRARLSATRWGVPMNGIQSRLTLRVAMSRRVGVRPDKIEPIELTPDAAIGFFWGGFCSLLRSVSLSPRTRSVEGRCLDRGPPLLTARHPGGR